MAIGGRIKSRGKIEYRKQREGTLTSDSIPDNFEDDGHIRDAHPRLCKIDISFYNVLLTVTMRFLYNAVHN